MSDREQIKNIAIKLANKNGLANLTRTELCKQAGISDGSFIYVMDCSFSEFIEEIRDQVIDKKVTITKSRLQPQLRRDQIMGVAIELAKKQGYNNVTRDAIAEQAGIAPGLVSNYYGTMTNFRRDIMRYAIANDVIEVIAQGLAARDNHAKKASDKQKSEAAKLIASF